MPGPQYKVEEEQIEAHLELARREFDAGRFGESIRCWRQILGLQPNHPIALTGLGAALQRVGRLGDARKCYEQAIECDAQNVDAHFNLGSVLQGLGSPELALASYHEALRLQPGHLPSAAGVAAILDWQGRYQEALELLSPIVESGQRDPEMLLIYARILRRFDRQKQAIELLQELLTTNPGPTYRQRAQFILGDLNDDLSNFAAAFQHYEQGNRLKQASFDPQSFTRLVDQMIEFFDTQRTPLLPGSAIQSEQPVFIVGMPRSGTSLVEQILASHSQVHAAGELTLIDSIASELPRFLTSTEPYPACVLNASAEILAAAAGEYLQHACAGRHEVLRVTDKMPLNFMHLGLIEMLFPKARVIHCRRNALDTCLSCYFQNFGANNMPFAYDLQHLGRFYRDYRRMMSHYPEVLSLPILNVDYEQLAGQQESVSREIIDFVGLDWEASCLEFHSLDRMVTTASHAQVRKPMYSSSVNRHRNYSEHIEGLIEALGKYGG